MDEANRSDLAEDQGATQSSLPPCRSRRRMVIAVAAVLGFACIISSTYFVYSRGLLTDNPPTSATTKQTPTPTSNSVASSSATVNKTMLTVKEFGVTFEVISGPKDLKYQIDPLHPDMASFSSDEFTSFANQYDSHNFCSSPGTLGRLIQLEDTSVMPPNVINNIDGHTYYFGGVQNYCSDNETVYKKQESLMASVKEDLRSLTSE